MTKNIFAIVLLTLAGISATAQEILTTPSYNQVIADQYRAKSKSVTKSASILTLPFYDDFSVVSVFPSALRWADAFVFVNTDYAKSPPSVGVATLDALDETGALYPNAGPNQFDADYLTSLPIRLDSILSPSKRAINRADSIFFSFYYQPQGRTISPPSKKASLILEFHSPGDYDTIASAGDTTYEKRWNEMWTTPGGITVDSFAQPDNRYFRQVIIPMTSIIDSIRYYKNGFQFRFRNIATLAGNSQPDWRNNGSHWNIDVVWLSNGRSINDTSMKDVAFGDQAPSMLKNYESMPFKQYSKNFVNEMKENIDIAISNLSNENRGVVYKYNMRKNSEAPFKEYDGGSQTLTPFATTGYTTYPAFAHPPVVSFFPPSTDQKVVFHIIHTLTPDPNPLFRSNDSIQYDQLFSNYYAYDNGTSEAGVGINGAGGSYAVQFKLNEADTLRGIQIFFNPVTSGINQEIIDLNVWNDQFGVPGLVVKAINGVTPLYPSSLNEFATYWFEEPVIVNAVSFPGLIFYIGWTQSSVNNLNVGFDRYKDSYSKRFYNVSGMWESSDPINYGSAMMRPIVGLQNPLDIENPVEMQQLGFQPNPVTDGKLIIRLPELWKSFADESLNINIISASGSLVLNRTFSNPVDLNSLAPGFYLVIITDTSSGRKASEKLIIK
jgi:hypothetical protein